MISYQTARRIIREQLRKPLTAVAAESVLLSEASGRVLAREVAADRDYPPFARSARDGYAVRAAEAIEGAALTCVGEIKAGDAPPALGGGAICLQIMTGAAVPAGADAGGVIGHTRRDGDTVHFTRRAVAGQNVIPQASEAKSGQTVLSAGMRVGYAELAQAA